MAARAPIAVDTALLRRWPLPSTDGDADKESRGHVLVVAGSREMPGAAWLAASGALRAGAGKLSVATAASVAAGLALMLPESRVIALRESASGGLRPAGVETLRESLGQADAVLLGPGWADAPASVAFAQRVLSTAEQQTPIVLDALAMEAVAGARAAGRRLLTPHAGEMAHLWGVDKQDVLANALAFSLMTSQRWQCVVALKGATTYVTTPDGAAWRHHAFRPGLGTSGSGDALAGIITGIAARGASLEQAAVWGVALHSRTGAALASQRGPVGYLASELLLEVPRAMHAMSTPRRSSRDHRDHHR